MADVTRFRMWRLKDGYFLLQSSKNSVPNAFSLSPWLNTNQSFIILRIKLYFARMTQSEIIESLAANSIMNATTIFKNCNHINLFYMHKAAKVFPLKAVIIFVFLSVYECSHWREFIHERATLSPYHRCGCSILVRGLVRSQQTFRWGTCSWQSLCYVPTVGVKHCCWFAATGEPLLGPLLHTMDGQQNVSQSKQRAITKIERTSPQEGEGEVCPSCLSFLPTHIPRRSNRKNTEERRKRQVISVMTSPQTQWGLLFK